MEDCPGRCAGCQGQVLIKELEGIGYGQECTDGDGRHDRWDGDAFKICQEFAPSIWAASISSGEIALNSGYVYDHHVPHHLPIHQDDQTPKTIISTVGDVNPKINEDPIDDQLPDITKNDAADEVWHEEHCAENIGAL